MAVSPLRTDVEAGDDGAIDRLRQDFTAQRAAYLRDPVPPAELRREHLRALVSMLASNRRRIHEALVADYGRHPELLTDLVEVAAPIFRAEAAIASLDAWMADEPRPAEGFGSSTAAMTWQPKGVLGMMTPWNFPFELTCGPLAEMLAAGNRVIVKPSELSPACSDLLAEMLAQTFDADHVTTAVGGLELAQTFPTLPWDHLMFTGSTAVGRRVMQAAAANLTSLTLELGGKCPVVLLDGGLTPAAVEAIVGLKLVKSGQVCVSVDHLLVPRAQLTQAAEMIAAYAATALAGYSRSGDCTGVISDRHAARLRGLVEEARRSGATVLTSETPDSEGRMLPLTVVVDPDPALALMHEEIFGPVLPLLPHDGVDDAIARINAGDRPLAIYVYGSDASEIDRLVSRTVSGGVTINGAGTHTACPSLAFGGVGASGFGRHHGLEGFREFSNPRAIFTTAADFTERLAVLPPYGEAAQAVRDAVFANYGG